jgi:hypothetical protein
MMGSHYVSNQERARRNTRDRERHLVKAPIRQRGQARASEDREGGRDISPPGCFFISVFLWAGGDCDSQAPVM